MTNLILLKFGYIINNKKICCKQKKKKNTIKYKMKLKAN